jgi:hypothetical protein
VRLELLDGEVRARKALGGLIVDVMKVVVAVGVSAALAPRNVLGTDARRLDAQNANQLVRGGVLRTQTDANDEVC